MSDPSNPGRTASTRSITTLRYAVAALAALSLVLIVALIVSRGDGDDDAAHLTSVDTTVPTITTAATPDTGPTTTASRSTSDPSTTTSTSDPSTTTVTTSTTAPSTTVPTVPTVPGGSTWTAVAAAAGDLEFTMQVADRVDGLVAYEGEADDGVSSLRCVAVVADGEASWDEWCGPAGQPARAIAVRDGVAWLVEIGSRPGEVALLEQPPGWTLPSNGCTAPIATVIETALTFDGRRMPAMATWIRCVPGEAFVGYGTVLLQPGPVDGGGALVVENDDGWTSFGPGTSYGCADLGDGVDRCEAFGVEDELFGALLPVPSPDTIGATDAVVGLVERTVEVESWIAGVIDPTSMETDVIDSVVVDRLFDPAAEVPASVRRADRLGYGGVNLLVVVIPQLDDSLASETWAVWIGALEETAGISHAVSWLTCARGITADGVCI